MKTTLARQLTENENEKEARWLFALVLLFVLLPLITIPGLVFTDDFSFHCSRIVSLAEGLKNGVFLPGVYPEFFNGAGYGSGLFYPDIFLYIPAIFLFFGFTEVQATKLFLELIVMLQGISMYCAVKKSWHSDKTAALSAIMYLLAVYPCVDLYYRSSLGEMLAFIFLPLVICGFRQICIGKIKDWPILMIGVSGLLLSHIITAFSTIIGIVIAFLIRIALKKINTEQFIAFLKAAGSSLLLTAFFILPMMEQMLLNPVAGDQGWLGSVAKWAVPLNQLILGLPSALGDGTPPPGIGLSLFGLAVLGISSSKRSVTVRVLCGMGLLLLFCCSTLFPWASIGEWLSFIQFPWRLYLFITVILCFCGGKLIWELRITNNYRQYSCFLCFGLMVIAFTANVNFRYQNNQIIYENPYPVFPAGCEYLPEETDYGVVANSVKLSEITLTRQNYNETSAELFDGGRYELPLVYYPGYAATLNGKHLDVSKSDKGLVTILTEEAGLLTIYYQGTFLRHLSMVISLLFTIGSVIYVSIKRRKGKQLITAQGGANESI